jgi:hypothetical protein
MAQSNDEALLQFISTETALFYAHLAAIREKFAESGDVKQLQSLFKQKDLREFKKLGKARANAGQRKPTAYNFYMKDKLAALKERGDERPHNERFKEVTSSWAALTKEEKDKYNEKYAPLIEAAIRDMEAAAGAGNGDGEGAHKDKKAKPTTSSTDSDDD